MKSVIKHLKPKNITMLLLGLLLMGLGISLYMNTNVGVGIWDALHMTLAEHTKINVGNWVTIVGVLVILFSQLIIFRPIYLLSIITGLIMGQFINLWMYIFTVTKLFNNMDHLLIRWIIFFVALIMLGSGIALVVLSKLPPTPVDVLMLSYSERFRLSYTFAKLFTEGTALISAVIVGAIYGKPFNNIALGTLCAILFTGVIIDFVTPLWKKLFKLF